MWQLYGTYSFLCDAVNFVFLPQDAFQLTILKVKAMEVMSFHQVAQGLRLKGSETRITNLPVKPKKNKKNRESAKKVSESFWDVTVQMQRGRNLRIGLKVSIIDRLNQLLSDFDNFLLAGYNTRSQKTISHTNWKRFSLCLFFFLIMLSLYFRQM